MPKKHKLRITGLDFSGSGAGVPEGAMLRCTNAVIRRKGEVWSAPTSVISNMTSGTWQGTGDDYAIAISPQHNQDDGTTKHVYQVVSVTESTSMNGVHTARSTAMGTKVQVYNFLGLTAGGNGSWSASDPRFLEDGSAVGNVVPGPMYVARGNLYMMTIDGLMKLVEHSDTEWTPIVDHVVGYDTSGSTYSNEYNGSNNWLETGKQVGYRAVVVVRDANGVIFRSAPSNVVAAVNNSGSTRAMWIPPFELSRHTLSTPGFTTPANTLLEVEIYRTRAVDSGATLPADYRYVLSVSPEDFQFDSTDTLIIGAITSPYNTSNSHADEVSEEDRGEPLYTNPDQGSESVANIAPPAALTHAAYQGHQFWGNVAERAVSQPLKLLVDPNVSPLAIQAHTLSSMVSGTNTGSVTDSNIEAGMYFQHSTCFPNGTYITNVSGVGPYTITTADNAADGTFSGAGAATSFYACAYIVWPDGTAERLPLAYSMVAGTGDTFSTHGIGATVPAGTFYDLSGPWSAEVYLWEMARTGLHRVDDNSSGLRPMIWVNHPDQFDGETLADLGATNGAPTTGGTDFREENLWPGRVYFSKYEEPEHTTADSWFSVGDSRKPIVGMRATRDSLFVMKHDGIYRVTGAGGNASGWRVDEFDLSHVCVGTHYSWSVMDNAIYGWSTRGPIKITDQGVALIGDRVWSLLSDVYNWRESSKDGDDVTGVNLQEIISTTVDTGRGAGGMGPNLHVQGFDETGEVFFTIPHEVSGKVNNGASWVVLVYNTRTDAWYTINEKGLGLNSVITALGLQRSFDVTTPTRKLAMAGKGIAKAIEPFGNLRGTEGAAASTLQGGGSALEDDRDHSQAYWRVDYGDDPTGFQKWMYVDVLWRPVTHVDGSNDTQLPRDFAVVFYPGRSEHSIIEADNDAGLDIWANEGTDHGPITVYVDCEDGTAPYIRGRSYRVLVPQEYAREESLIIGVRWDEGALLGCSVTYQDGGDRVGDGAGTAYTAGV